MYVTKLQKKCLVTIFINKNCMSFFLKSPVNKKEGGRVLEAGSFLEKLDVNSKKKKREEDEGQGDIKWRLEWAGLGVQVWPGMATAQDSRRHEKSRI